MKLGIFFEPDGVLNIPRTERGQQVQPRSFEDFKINAEAIQPVMRLKKAGFLVIACTNQPGLSRGTLSRRELDLMHQVLRHRFQLDDILICPHDQNDRCNCQKPNPGLLTEAAFKWHLNLEHCFVVSDKWQDADAARVVGATSLLLKSSWNGSGHHDFILPNLNAITDKILQLQGSVFSTTIY